MEFNDLKNTWKDLNNLQADQQQLDEQEIRRLLEKRTYHPVTQIKRSIFFELLFLLAMTIAFAIGYQRLSPELVRFGVILLCIAWPLTLATFIPPYLQAINVYNGDESLKDNLQKLVNRLNWSTRIYRFVALLAPAFGFLWGNLVYRGHSFEFSMEYIFFYGGLAILACIIFYPFAHWYLKRLYGDHIQELTDCLKEFD